ncbi:hypothetical protein ARMSODRAFT_1023302 [Armillaria solidipes]|uniref:Uncharacterized protein n=1 Tax=Armillaria solidipes TaxID=1076256 RepID=A0A2H3AZP6_9AGAR|nr:hypothetical protein ARMSODRAFT_1023302 [Armillaria solidipes]
MEESSRQNVVELAEDWKFWRKLPRLSQACQDPLFHKLQMDATDEESVKAAARHVGGIDGKLNILVNNEWTLACLRVNESRLEPSHPSSGTSFATIRDIPICVNVISPGPFASEMAPPGFLELLLKTAIMPGLVQVPARRHGSEAEMGITVVLLAVSSYTNRVILRVYG